MKREDAKRKVVADRTMHNVENTINDIFDDFESRICGNCKYFTECEDGFNYCDIHSRLNGFVTHDFGCNKFERKGE